jgi:hypothetical protein
MVAAFLIGASLVAAVEYAANIQLRAGAETASNAAQAANSALGQVRMELAALRTGLDQPGRRGGDGASVHAIREEIAGLQWRLAEIDAAQESAIARLGQRLDASESEQAQASQRLAGLAENMSRLERRISAIAEQSATSASTTAQKQNERLPSIDGWRVVDMSGQRAIVRNPSGRLYEVASGSEVPGLGIVENVRRTGKRVTVVTPRGVITAVLE